MTTAREEADRIVQDAKDIPSNDAWKHATIIDTSKLRTAIEAALLFAREAGRVEGLEEGAKVADRQINHDPAVIGNTDERITHRHCAMDIASAIRALKTEPRP